MPDALTPDEQAQVLAQAVDLRNPDWRTCLAVDVAAALRGTRIDPLPAGHPAAVPADAPGDRDHTLCTRCPDPTTTTSDPLTPAERIVRDALGKTDAMTYHGRVHDLDALARATATKLAATPSAAPAATGSLADVIGNAVYEAGVGRPGPDPTWQGVAAAATSAADAWFARTRPAATPSAAPASGDLTDEEVVRLRGWATYTAEYGTDPSDDEAARIILRRIAPRGEGGTERADAGEVTTAEVIAWHRARFGEPDDALVALKGAEEMGEVAGAVVKRAEGAVRPAKGMLTRDDWTRHLLDEVGDVGIVLHTLCAREGTTLGEVVTRRFRDDVSLRTGQEQAAPSPSPSVPVDGDGSADTGGATPGYPFRPNYDMCADEACSATWTGTPGSLPTTCPDSRGPSVSVAPQPPVETARSVRRHGDAISAACWDLRQGADPVETARRIEAVVANVSVHSCSSSVPSPVDGDGSAAGSAALAVLRELVQGEEHWTPERDEAYQAARRRASALVASASASVDGDGSADEVRTAEELDALPVGTVIRAGWSSVFWRGVEGWSGSRPGIERGQARPWLVERIGCELVRVIDRHEPSAPVDSDDGSAVRQVLTDRGWDSTLDEPLTDLVARVLDQLGSRPLDPYGTGDGSYRESPRPAGDS